MASSDLSSASAGEPTGNQSEDFRPQDASGPPAAGRGITAATEAQRATEDDQLRLTEYLIDKVIDGISGRDGDEFDTLPARTIFSGVLEAVREGEIVAARQGLTGVNSPSGTAIGLDFRIRADDPAHGVSLRITPRWSHYYAAFPTWEQAAQAYGLSLAGAASPTIPGESNGAGDGVAAVASDIDDESTEGSLAVPADSALADVDAPDAEAADDSDDEVPDEIEAEDAALTGTVKLRPVWRRVDARPGAIVVKLSDANASEPVVANSPLQFEVDRARAVAESDIRAWRHLGAPKDRERTLGSAAALASADAYERTLASIARDRAPLPAWTVSLDIEADPDPSAGGVTRVRVLLANGTLRPSPGEGPEDPGVEERALFDAGLDIEVFGGTLVPFDFLLAPRDYRSSPQMPARGINCTAVRLDAAPSTIRTETLPVFRQPLYRTREGLEVTFESLDVDDPTALLDQLAAEMDRYLETWDEFLDGVAPSKFKADEVVACRSDRDEFLGEIKRFRLGLECLRRDSLLADAFRLMNRTFRRLSIKSGGRIRAWRLFQIGFIVSQLPSLAVRELPSDAKDPYAEALRANLDEVGILWFPTGGGKTEAYLGLIAAALIYDRLRGKTRGLSAWMRFPLRMLSLQQMERLARVIAALNELRADVQRLQVGDPFALGYYVGGGNTPNSIDDASMRKYETSSDQREREKILRNCPFCDSRVEIRAFRSSWRLAHVCSNEDCFSNRSDTLGHYKGSLPVCIVDQEIYRYLPSVIVGTIDKLAVVGRNRSFAHLMRGVRQACPSHGYASYNECLERWSGCKTTRRSFEALDAVKDPGPMLLIQDELHLLRAELGVFDGHYEGLLQYLGRKVFLPPKVLAATATIEAYDVQAFHLYLSRARRYPQPSWEQGESFYATSQPARNRRIYIGIRGHTRGVEEPALRALALYQREVRRLIAAPSRAAVQMGRPDLSDEAVLDILRLHDLSLCYVNRRATAGSIADKLGQVERSLEVDGLGKLRHETLISDRGIEVVGRTIERVEAERKDTGQPRLDVIIATNLISHGVDLERINMMVLCGMPSHYAEYVQATSRSARSHPGAVFVCFRARDARETSQYEFFPVMHEHMDRLIEAVAVNRFATGAPTKTVPGLLGGVLLSGLSPDLFTAKRIARSLDDIPTLKTALAMDTGAGGGTEVGCVDRDDLVSAIEEIVGVDRVRFPASPAQVEHTRRRVADAVEDQLGIIERTFERRLPNAIEMLTSFRDVDEGVEFGSKSAVDLAPRLGIR